MTAKPFDLASLDLAQACDNPYEFELEHPATGDGLGIFLSVVGAESATFQAFVRAEGNKARRRRMESERRGKDEPVTIEAEESALISAVSACLTGWRTVTDGKSEPVIVWGDRRLEFTADNARDVLRHFRWMVPQVNKATGDLTHFIKA